MNYNKVVIVGHVTHTPDIRTTPSGQSVLSIGVATNRAWTDKNGEKLEATEFHNVVIWGKLADTAGAYLEKGSLVLVEGHLTTRSWTDKNGVERRSTEIIAEGVQFGPRTPTKAVAEPKKEQSTPTSRPEGDEEDSSRTLVPLFDDVQEIRVEDIPF